MSNFPKCAECGAYYPAHYGSCSQVSDEMKAALAQAEADNNKHSRENLAKLQGGWGPGPSQSEREATRANVVREALLSLQDDATAFRTLAYEASDTALLKLARLLK